MTLTFVEQTISVDGVVMSYEKTPFHDRNDAVDYYNKLWLEYKNESGFKEDGLSFSVGDSIHVRVGTTEI
jgi:hypothetical protein